MKKTQLKIVMFFLLLGLLGCSKSSDKEESAIVFQTLSSQLSLDKTLFSSIEPFTFKTVIEETVLAKQKTLYRTPADASGGYSWLANKVSNGSPKKELNYYRLTYDIFGNLISKTLIPESSEMVESQPIIYEYYGEPEIGAVFFPKNIWRYGSDCKACYPDSNGYAGFSSGISVGTHSVRQSDGTWQEGITFDGYYLVASSTKLPLCTVLEISNHSFKGEGLQPGVTFKAIIADRGVPENTLDLFVGSEKNLGIVKMTNSKHKPKVTIVGFGVRGVDASGHRGCVFN